MVVKIQKTYPHMKNTLDYNERKVSAHVAERIGVLNVSGNKKDIYETFRKYERWNIRSDKVSFQMSINPNTEDGEKLTDEQAVELTKKIMEKLGYQNQPIVIYKHKDIDREHYHVVSIRTNEKGKKIKDYKEAFITQKILKTLEKEFGFKVGEANKADKAIIETPIEINDRFSAKEGNVCRQYESAFEKAMEYRFSTFTQFKAIMQWYGVNVQKRQDGLSEHICLQGLDMKGEGNAPFVSQRELDKGDMLSEIMRRAEENKKSRIRFLSERRRLSEQVLECLRQSKSEEDFVKRLEQRKIGFVASRRHDDSIFGITFVDHENKMAFKGTELDKSINAGLFKDLEENSWNTDIVMNERVHLVDRNDSFKEQHEQYLDEGFYYEMEEQTPEEHEDHEALDLVTGVGEVLGSALASAGRGNNQTKPKRKKKPKKMKKNV